MVQEEHAVMDEFLEMMSERHEHSDSAVTVAWSQMKQSQTMTTELSTAIEKRSRFKMRIAALVRECQEK